MTATGARRVVLVHWDDFFVSLDRPLRPLRYPMDDLGRTLARLTVLAGEQGVELQLPVPWVATSPAAFPEWTPAGCRSVPSGRAMPLRRRRRRGSVFGGCARG